MKRRDFLKLCGTGLGGWVFLPSHLLGQEAAVTDLGLAAATGDVPGVTSSGIRIGMSAAFTGSSAGLGSEYFRGSQAYYQGVNDGGGINGRQINLVALDDGYEPVPTIQNTIRLVEQENVFFLSNYVGTPTLTRALPVIKRYSDQNILMVGNFTGAQPQREDPYADQIFNIRASYRQEMMALVEGFWQAGLRRFGVFYQIDAYGRSGTDGVARGLELVGSKIVAEATYRRGARFEDDMSAAVNHLRQAEVDVVLCTGSYQGCGAFIRSARTAGWNVPISNVSFVGCDLMLGLLLAHGDQIGQDLTGALVNSQVVPSYDDTSLPGVVEYRAAMDRWNPTLPTEVADPNYTPEGYSFISLEGYINARVICEALALAGANPTRASFKQALESLADLDVGIGAPISFSSESHQGLDQVYFTHVEGRRWVPVTDWAAAIRA